MLKFGVLGSLTVDFAGETVAVPAGRTRTLLGAMVVHFGTALTVDVLVDMLWGASPPRTAPTALHGHISRLRKALGDDAVLTTPGGYLLHAAVSSLDSDRFRAAVTQARNDTEPARRSQLLRQGLALWRGPALADFCFEPFAQPEIAALEEMRAVAIEDAIEADLTLGRHGAVTGELRSLVHQYPLRERLWGHLMIALYQGGRQAEALAVYRQARELMAAELGVEPGPALRNLETAILHQDERLIAPIMVPEHGRVQSGGRLPARSGDITDAAFVGRTAELRRLHALQSQTAAEQQPALVTVIGEAGIGKSRLVSEFLASVSPQAAVYKGQCDPDLGSTYAPLHEVLAQIQLAPDDPAIHILSRLQHALEGATNVGLGVIEAAAADLFATLARRQPIVVLVEDIHWAQPGLIDLLEAVAAKAEAAVMIVCLARPGLTSAVPSSYGAIESLTVELRPMSPAEIGSLVLDVAEPGTPASAVGDIVSAAEGNPFFALQLMAWAGDSTGLPRLVPVALRKLLADRVTGLGPGELTVMYCAAIAGRDFAIEAVLALLPSAAWSSLRQHLDVLERRQLLQQTSTGYRFRHHLIHRTAYTAIDPDTRARLHEAFADWLIAEAPADPALADETIGHHLEQAHGNLQSLGMRDEHARELAVRAAAHLGAAGRRAFRRVDMAGAASLLLRALKLIPRDHPDRLALLVDAGRPLRTSGRTSEAVTVLLEAIDRAVTAGDLGSEWRSRLELTFLRASVASTEPGEEEILAVAGKAVPALESVGDDDGLAFAWMIIGSSRGAAGELTSAKQAFQRAAAHTLRNPGHPNSVTIAWGLSSVLLDGDTPVGEAIAGCRELLTFGGQSQPGVMFDLAVLLAMDQDFEEALTVLAGAAANAHTRGARRPPLFLANAYARVELAAGELANAERHARRGLELGAKLGGDEIDSANAIVLAQSLCRQGNVGEAEQIIAAYAGLTSTQDIGRFAMLNAVRAELRACRNAWADAVELSNRALNAIEPTELFTLRGDLRLTLATILQGAGDIPTANQTATEALHLFKAKGNRIGYTRAQALLR